ncbi:MAG: serine/threonine protein kinase [Archangiaceae bacterium]|nr:serine/threonine protein kinase [Archangiaceae bacterium]
MTTLEARTATDSQRSPGSRRHEPKELTRGTTIGRYVVLEQLGQGGMGIVYAAWDFVLERRIALKLLHATGRVAPESGAQALVREAQVMARLAHPGINAVYDVGTFEGRTFLAMELADAGSLSAWLRRTPRSADQVLPLLLQAGQGLAAAHRANIAHGDFKPQNVLLTRDGRARVTDFGLAGEALATARLDEPQAGTPPYMAPERLAGGSVSAAADQYSYAVTLYEALCGRRPFGGASVGDLDASIRRGPPAVERLPRTVRSAVLRALAPDPAARFASMDALLEALDPRRPHQRRNAALAVAAAVVLVGVGYARGRLVPSEAPCGGGDQALSRVFTPFAWAPCRPRREPRCRPGARGGRAPSSRLARPPTCRRPSLPRCSTCACGASRGSSARSTA